MMQKKITKQAIQLSLIFIFFISFVSAYAQPPCVSTAIGSIAPISGPSGTVVTLTGLGFTLGAGTTSVKFNGVEAASYTVVSNTQITAVAPATGATGIVTIITNGCQASGPVFTYLQTNCSNNEPEIYISELYDHVPGSYGVIELYNPSPTNTVTFNGQYVLERYGSIGDPTASYTLTLTGSIGPEETYLVLSYGTGEMGCTVVTDASMGTGINAEDEFKLKKNSVVIDYAHAPNDTGYTVIRNPNAVAPNTAYSDSDWTFNLTQSCADLGSHNALPSTPAVTITSQPLDDVACLVENASFTVGLSNTTGVTYQWKTLVAGVWVNASGDNYTGATSATLTVTGATLLQNNTQYYCQITVSPTCTLLTEAVQLTVTPLPTATFTVVQPTCLLPTGIITLIPGAGLTLTYSLNGGAFVSNPVFSTLDPGTYTVTIQTAGGCTATLSIVVNNPPGTPDVATTSVTQPTCTTATGTITVTAPLDATYTYTLNAGTPQASPVFSGLAPGNYTVTVTNALGCTSVTPTIVVNPAPVAPPVATTTVIQPDCTTPTGTINVSEITGIGYTYSINGGTPQPGTSFPGLLPGNYTITTQNAAGCTSVTPIIVINAAPNAPAVATTTVTQPDCATTSGSITITAPTGTGITYSVNGSPFSTDLIYPNLTAGSYTITVQNAAGCTSVTQPIIINATPVTPTEPTTTVVQPDCTNPVASITVTAPTGAEYQYSINGGPFQDSPVFNPTVAGDYTITAQHDSGCTATTAPITIVDVPNAPAQATTDIIHPDCVTTTGTITVTGPVEAAYLYSIDNGALQASTVFTGVAPGDHIITVQNIAGCTSVVTVTVNPVPTAPAVATVTTTDPSCSSTLGGTITVTSPIGTGIYTYSVDGGNTFDPNPVFTGLIGGTYTIIVQSTTGCTSVTAPININAGPSAPDVATTTLIQPDCTTPTGSITITAPLDAGNTYSLNNGPFVTNTTFDGLAEGNYTITVQNAGGCTSVTGQLHINAAPTVPPVATTTVIQPDCATPLGTITVTAPLGNYVYSLDNGFFQATTVFTGLTPGDHTITVQNTSGGCTSVTTITINPAPVNPAVATTTQVQPSCSTGTGSITISAPVGAEYSYSLNGGAYQAAATFGNLVPGSYTITVQTTGGCTATTSAIIINAPSDLPQLTGSQGCEATIGGRNYLLNGLPAGNTFDPSLVTYEWRVAGAPAIIGNDATFNVTEYTLTSSLSINFPIDFELTVTTAGGCEATLLFTVDGIFCDIPRGISPNNDSMNDNFDLTGLNVRSLKIFNRYGLEVYNKGNYSNEWFGQANSGDELPTGTYFYVIDLADTTKTGWVYINRQTN